MEQTEEMYVSVGKSNKKFLMCEMCMAAISVGNSGNNETLEFFYDPETHEITEISKNDLTEFLNNHEGHRLEKLIVIDGPLSRQPLNEPINEKFYYVEKPTANGSRGERFVLKSWREQINEPLHYQIAPGQLIVWVAKIEPPDLKKVIAEILKKNPRINDLSIDFFTNGISAILKMEEMPIRNELSTLEPLLDQHVAAITNHPLTIFLQLNDYFLTALKYIVNQLPKNDQVYLQDFIDQENTPCGLLALRVSLDFLIRCHNIKEGKNGTI